MPPASDTIALPFTIERIRRSSTFARTELRVEIKLCARNTHMPIEASTNLKIYILLALVRQWSGDQRPDLHRSDLCAIAPENMSKAMNENVDSQFRRYEHANCFTLTHAPMSVMYEKNQNETITSDILLHKRSHN